MSRLDEIAQRAASATEGPWSVESDGLTEEVWASVEHLPFDPAVAHDVRDRDAEFIAAARSDVPWLLARVRELETAVAELVRAAEKWMILPYNAPLLVDARAALASAVGQDVPATTKEDNGVREASRD